MANARDLWRGQCVVWRHTPRGGYGYVLRIPAVVREVHGRRVTIAVESARGKREVTVPATSLIDGNQRHQTTSEREAAGKAGG